MTKQKKKKNTAIIIFVVCVVVLVAVLAINSITRGSNSTNKKVDYSGDQYTAFLEELTDYVEEIDETEDAETVNLDLLEKVVELQKKYEGGTGVSYAANTIITDLTETDTSTTSTSDTTSELLTMINGLKNVYFSDSSSDMTLSISSETACNSSWIDSKYCVSTLSAEVYVTDSSSSKWVVLLHGYTMTGEQIYNALGEMYTSQGYNVIAPDLRGAGGSDGSAALGYLEALDVYDWIKDLNTNYESRYGVSVAPDTIIVHGVSLGAATTLQLATNPDIAAASGYPYEKTLTELHVKGFVDDCGYTSMTKIVSDLFSLGDSEILTVLTSYLGTTLEDLMTTVESLSQSLSIDSFENYFSDYSYSDAVANSDISSYMDTFSSYFNSVLEESQNSSSSNSSSSDSSSSNSSSSDSSSSTDNSSTDSSSTDTTDEYTIPSIDQETITEWWNNYSNYSNYSSNYSYSWGTSSEANDNLTASAMNKLSNTTTSASLLSTTSTSSDLTDELVMMALIQLVGVGLTDDNYDYYSNIFADGRSFPSGSNVIIIHGTGDTIVDHSNSDIIASHILTTGDANLLYKWDIEDGPHAGIVIGLQGEKYTNLIKNFINCTNDSSQCSVFSSSDTEAALNS